MSEEIIEIKIYDSFNEKLKELRCYRKKFLFKKLITIEYYEYNESNLMTKKTQKDGRGKLIYEVRFIYDDDDNPYCEIYNHEFKQKLGVCLIFKVFDSKGRELAFFAETYGRYRYSHQFKYDISGDKNTVSMATLINGLSIEDIFYRAKPYIESGKINTIGFCSHCQGESSTKCQLFNQEECVCNHKFGKKSINNDDLRFRAP